MDNWVEFLVSTLPQLNRLIKYRWVIVHAAHGTSLNLISAIWEAKNTKGFPEDVKRKNIFKR